MKKKQAEEFARRHFEGRDIVEIDTTGIPPTVELLNQVALFEGRIKFAKLWRTGPMIQAEFADGRRAHWRGAIDLRTFARSQDIIFEARGFLMHTPGNRAIKHTWETVARMIRAIADQNATDLDPPLQDEFQQVIRSTWERAFRPEAKNRIEFNQILRECLLQSRDNAGPPRCCVWIDEQSVWVHQPTFEDWLSTPGAKGSRF